MVRLFSRGIARTGGTIRPVALDLFAGAGGLSCGFEAAGFDVLAAVEYDPVHMATHEFNFPLTRAVCADVSRLDAQALRAAVAEGARLHGRSRAPARLDVIFGGPPCQGFSTIGKRLIDDERNQLVFHFFRIVTELRPRYFVMENVPGMNLGGHSSILAQLRDEFARAGYQTADPKVLNAAEFGVPQDRRRLFLLGWAEGETPVVHPSPRVTPVPKRPTAGRRPQPGAELGPTVWDAIGDLPDLDEFEALLNSDSVRLPAAAFRRMEATVAKRRSGGQSYAYFLRHPEADAENLMHARSWDSECLTSSMRTVHTDLSISRFADTLQGEVEPVSRFYRLPAGGLCNTLRAGTGSERGAYTSPRPIHPTLPRVISVREAARLHSFPDWFRLHQTKWHGFRQVGNAVPPLLGRAVAREIVRGLRAKPTRPESIVSLGSPELLGLTMDSAAEHFGAVREHMPKPRKRLTPATR